MTDWQIGSITELTAPHVGAYGASKAALHAYNEVLRLELAGLGIDVMFIMIGECLYNFELAEISLFEKADMSQAP